MDVDRETCSPASSRSRLCARANSASASSKRPSPKRSMPRACWSTASVPGSAAARSDSSARVRWRSASAKRPIRTSAMPAIANAPVVIDWLVQPCSSAIASARSLSSSASGSGCPVSGAAIARCARQPISMNGREIRRVRLRASSRCCRASCGMAGPQFRDAQVHQRECPVIRPYGQLVCVCRRAERCLQCAHCFLSLGQIVAPAGELDPR